MRHLLTQFLAHDHFHGASQGIANKLITKPDEPRSQTPYFIVIEPVRRAPLHAYCRPKPIDHPLALTPRTYPFEGGGVGAQRFTGFRTKRVESVGGRRIIHSHVAPSPESRNANAGRERFGFVLIFGERHVRHLRTEFPAHEHFHRALGNWERTHHEARRSTTDNTSFCPDCTCPRFLQAFLPQTLCRHTPLSTRTFKQCRPMLRRNCLIRT